MRYNLCFLVIISIMFTSCKYENMYFEDIARIDNHWDKEDFKTFSFPVKHDGDKYDIFFIIRNNNQYQYRNIYFFTEMKSPKGEVLIDTLEYQLADSSGKWIGSGISEIKQSKLVYKESIYLRDTGTYKVNISHAMREKDLIGIEDLSLIIEKK